MLSPTEISNLTHLKAQAELQRDSAEAMIRMCDKILNGRGKKVDREVAKILARLDEPMKIKRA